jgi:hypothetical protein
MALPVHNYESWETIVSRVAFTSDTSINMQQTIQNLLQADERLLWWDCPQLKKMRFPLTTGDIIAALIFGIVSAVLFTALFYMVKSIYTQRPSALSVNIEIFSGIFVCGLLFAYQRPLQRTCSDILKAVPPYRQYTFYAITDRRAMIIISLPGMEPTVLEYLPHEIETPMSLMRPDGAGILIFGPARRSKISAYGPSVVLPGSFLGISNVQDALILLQNLKARSEPFLPQTAEHMCTC